jgi:hypothetical protein
MAKADEPIPAKGGAPVAEPVPADAEQRPPSLIPLDEEQRPPSLIPLDEEQKPPSLIPLDEEQKPPSLIPLDEEQKPPSLVPFYEAQPPPERVARAAEAPADAPADAPTDGETPPPRVAGATPKALISRDVMKSVWRGETDDGQACAVIVLNPDRTGPEEEVFAKGAHRLLKLTRKRPHRSVLHVTAVSDDGRACVTDLWTVGTVADLPALGWDLDRRLKLFRGVCEGLAVLHAVGIVHGCLRPANVLLDDDLSPVLSDAGMFDLSLSLGGDTDGSQGFGLYASPEARFSMAMGAWSDVFSAGCLLHFLLLEKDPPECDEAIPRLDSIVEHAPAGLVRIVRKCVLAEADQRYATIKDLLADLDKYAKYEEVGLAHPDVKETNLTTAFPIVGAREGRSGPAEHAAHAAIPLKPRAQAASTEAPDVVSEREYVSQRTLIVVGAIGSIVMVACLIYAYSGAVGGMVARIVMGIGAAMSTALMPIEFRHENAVRGGIAVATLALVIALNPSARVTTGGASTRVRSKDRAASVEATKKLLAAGEADLVNAQLRNADLSGLNFTNAHLDSADLVGANLQNTDCTGTSWANAWILRTNFTGAKLNNPRDFEKAHCDGSTTMPAGWECVDRQPAPARPQ